MNFQEISKKLASTYPQIAFEVIEGAKHPVSQLQTGDASIFVPAESLIEVCKKLKSLDEFAFDCLSNLTAVDQRGPNKDRFEVVYSLFSYKHNHSVTLKVSLPREDTAHVESLEGVWPAATWMEREVYDLFGIRFDHHSDMRRIMLPEDWIGHPLRKDYKEEQDYHGISTTRASMLE